MFRDLGFVLFLAKDIAKLVSIFVWGASGVLMHTAAAPWDWVFFGIFLGGFVFSFFVLILPMIKDALNSKYRAYRAKKEEAWDILKESK